jgi:hypothetical protein
MGSRRAWRGSIKPRSVPRHSLAGFAFLLALVLLLARAIPALADYLGPDRTVTVWGWERLRCHYEAVYDPPGTGWYACTLDLYDTPDSSCPPPGSAAGYFSPSACGWPQAFCQIFGCGIAVSGSAVSCSEGETGCRAIEHTSTLPEATASGSVSCGVPGSGGWCRGAAELNLSGSEPLAEYSILALEGTRNGAAFACPGAACSVPLLEGTNDFTFWAISSWGDTSSMGTASGSLDTQAPVIWGEASGATGDNGWYVSEVAFSASASDPSPGAGLSGLEVSLDGGGWAAYTGPLTLTEGSHSVDLRAADVAGNVSTLSQVIGVDTEPPALDMVAGDAFCPGCGETLEVSLDVQDPLSGIAEWALDADGTAIAGGTDSTSQALAWDGSGLPGGVHTLLLRARDAAGNTQATSLAVTLLVPAPPPAADTPCHPFSGPLAAAPTMTPVPTETQARRPTATRTLRPTRTAELIRLGGAPAASVDEGGEGPIVNPQPDELGSAPAAAPTASGGGVLWGGAALALIASATAVAVEASRRRREEEARLRAEMASRNAEAGAREQEQRRSLAAMMAAAAAAAAETLRQARDRWFERREQRREEQEIAARQRAEEEARRQREAEEEARRRAAAIAQAERLRQIAEGRDEAPSPSNPMTEAIAGIWLTRAFRWLRSGRGVSDASQVTINPLESGHVSIRVSPDVPVGSRVPLRQRFGLAGTRYNPETVIEEVGRSRVRDAASRSSILFALGTSLLGNLWDYTLGEHHEEGLGREFLVSTAVDTLLAVAIGVAAIAGVTVVATLAGITFPTVGAALAVVAGVGFVMGLALEWLGVGDWSKSILSRGLDALGFSDTPIPGTDHVREGLEAWPGILDNAGEILRVGARHTWNALGESVRRAGQFFGDLFGG